MSKNILSKGFKRASTLLEKAKDVTSTTNIVKKETSQTPNLRDLKSGITQKIENRENLIKLLGMEVLELYKMTDFMHQDLLPFLEKIILLDEELKTLELEIKKVEAENVNKKICECGEKIKGNQIFCPKCGEITNTDYKKCTCGKILEKNALFCSICGAKNSEHTQSQIKNNKDIPCTCGHLILSGQSICTECGRLAND